MNKFIRDATKLANRIYISSILEWFILFVVLFIGYRLALNYTTNPAIYLLPALPLFGMFMMLSQIRSALLVTNATTPIDLARIRHTVFAAMRFLAIVLLMAVIVVFFGAGFLVLIDAFAVDEAMLPMSDSELVSVYIRRPIIMLPVFICAGLMLFILSSLMVPLATIANSLGNDRRHYDPFFGFAAYKKQSFLLTVFLFCLWWVGMSSIILMANSINNLDFSATISDEDMTLFLAVGIFLTGFFWSVWVSSIWFSACAIQFTKKRQDSLEESYLGDMKNIHIFQQEELQELRRARTKD